MVSAAELMEFMAERLVTYKIPARSNS